MQQKAGDQRSGGRFSYGKGILPSGFNACFLSQAVFMQLRIMHLWAERVLLANTDLLTCPILLLTKNCRRSFGISWDKITEMP